MNLFHFFQWGYGNWKEIAHHIETKTPEQTKQEYLRNYIYGVVGRYTWKEELRGYQIDHTQVNLLKRVKDFLRSTQNLKKSSSWFGRLLSECTKHEEDCAKFCVLLRMSELYYARTLTIFLT